jgi:wyosine [tRNA(Phe)-imidazoG37] synthetase (radical SAM superfamily)
MSLGVDIVPLKTCTLNCVYCECGATTLHTIERTEYVPAEMVIDELDSFLEKAPSLDIDVITFAGGGEPTLNTSLGEIINYLKSTYPQYKIALLTNSTLFYLEEIRKIIMPLDYVLPSVDAVSQPVFEKINNPVSGLNNSIVIEGLIAFSREYTGTLWTEIFIVPGINDTETELKKIKEVLEEIHPARVQLNTLDRPGTFSWVEPATVERLNQIASFLLPLPVEIISRKFQNLQLSSEKPKNIKSLFTTLERRPLTIEDLAVALKISINEADAIVEDLIMRKVLSSENVGGTIFYKVRQ